MSIVSLFTSQAERVKRLTQAVPEERRGRYSHVVIVRSTHGWKTGITRHVWC